MDTVTQWCKTGKNKEYEHYRCLLGFDANTSSNKSDGKNAASMFFSAAKKPGNDLATSFDEYLVHRAPRDINLETMNRGFDWSIVNTSFNARSYCQPQLHKASGEPVKGNTESYKHPKDWILASSPTGWTFTSKELMRDNTGGSSSESEFLPEPMFHPYTKLLPSDHAIVSTTLSLTKK